MMDSWWNPSVEDQAFDRVHRLGQRYPVNIIRFIMRNSIEERVLTIQERKRTEAALALNESPAPAAARREDDLRLLFDMEPKLPPATSVAPPSESGSSAPVADAAASAAPASSTPRRAPTCKSCGVPRKGHQCPKKQRVD
jgi:hypothetical protein